MSSKMVDSKAPMEPITLVYLVNLSTQTGATTTSFIYSKSMPNSSPTNSKSS